MHIAIVTETYPPEINGVALTVRHFVEELDGLGHEVSVIRPQRDDAPPERGRRELRVPSLPVPRYPGLRVGLPAHRGIRRAWRERQPDAVYVATEGPLGWSAVRVARSLGIPCATGFHTRFDEFVAHYGAAFLSSSVMSLLRRFHEGADATLVPTASLRDFLSEARFRNVRLLSRGIDCTLFDPARREDLLRLKWGLAPHELAVIHVGRLAPEKNLGLVAQAFDAIKAEQPHGRLVWIGDGPAAAQLRAERPADIFAGMQRGASLATHYASGDLFLFPSLTETFGNVTLEALASGVPIVAFDYGAAREFVRDGANGRAIAFGDHAAFIEAARQLAADGAQRQRFSHAGRSAVSCLSHREVAMELVRVLESLRPAREGVPA